MKYLELNGLSIYHIVLSTMREWKEIPRSEYDQASHIIVKCPITNYYFDMLIKDKDAQIVYISTDYKHPKAFFALMRLMVGEMKGKGCQTITMSIYSEEYETSLKSLTTWKMTKYYHMDRTCDITCSIDEFINNYMAGISDE